MDELVNIDLLNELEAAEVNELDHEPAENVIERNPFVELSNTSFKAMFRLNKDLCIYLIALLEPLMRPKMKPTDLDIQLRILITVRFFASGSYQMDIGSNIFLNVSQASVSRCINEVVTALNHPDIFNQFIKFPNTLRELDVLRRKFYDKYNVPGIIGCIDCTHVAIFPPRIEDPDYPEYLYINRKGYHSINVQVCDSNLKIININARYPGSTNDAFIWSNSNLQHTLRNLHGAGYNDYYLLGDSGYPLRTWLMTPLEEELPPHSPEHRYNVSHKMIRSLIERCNGVLKLRWRCLLRHRVLHYAPDFACNIINACAVLHNLCIEHGLEEPDFADAEFNDDNYGDGNHDPEPLAVGIERVNPELAEGRRVRARLIRNVFTELQ